MPRISIPCPARHPFQSKRCPLVRADLFRESREVRPDTIQSTYLPFLPERSGHWIDRALDGGESGRETVGRFLQELEDHLLPGGRALLLISSLTGLPEVTEMACSQGLYAEAVLCEKYFFEQLYVLRIRAKEKTGEKPNDLAKVALHSELKSSSAALSFFEIRSI